MKTSTLENKTIRPGLMRYSFYASERRPLPPTEPIKVHHKGRHIVWLAIAVLILAAGATYALMPSQPKPPTPTASNKVVVAPKKSPAVMPTPPPPSPTVNDCAGNSVSQFIKVSISKRHMWACQGTQGVYDSAVVTGIAYLPADKTPLGTYHIYGKYTDQTLKGTDTTGSWNDPVSYWMPFLTNQYGEYGFHDATWRSDSDFGNINPYSANASHGCVEMPLQAAKWLYNWAAIGTTVDIVS